MAACEKCNARGTCPTCKGTGKTGGMLKKAVCPDCQGRKNCSACRGMGRT